MKKKYYLTLYLLVCFPVLYAQNKTYIQRTSLGMHVFVDHFSKKEHNTVTGLAMNYLHGITPRTDWQITLAGTFVKFPVGHQQSDEKHFLLEADASIHEKLFPGRRPINPFLQVGMGVSQTSAYYGIFLPVGLGAQWNLPGETFLLLHTQYRVPVTQTQTGHIYLSLGIAGIIGKNKTTKKRPVAVPAHTYVSLKDTDGDGIPDSTDACPLVAGLRSHQGCPDTSRRQAFFDSDKDRDGIIDSLDKCPDLPGFKEYEGCPPVTADIRRKIELAARNVFFETDKYVLLPASFGPLDEVAQIMRDNPYLKLAIAGHTDNAGTDEKNQSLSEHRAQAVLDYLLQRGLSKDRISSAGYGCTKPIADNGTPEGRAKNRRVEFVLRY